MKNVKQIIKAFENLGGTAHYSRLYEEVRRIRIQEGIKLPKSWKAIIRRDIESRSSDSEVYVPGKPDLFYSVHGIGKGYWGLRDFKQSNLNFKTQKSKSSYEENKELGDAGEKFVLEKEKEFLKSRGRGDLAEKVEQVSLKHDGCGYDVLSFELTGEEKFIEVKTTEGKTRNAFELTSNEFKVSKQSQNYWLFRVSKFNKEDKVGEIKCFKAPLEDHFDLTCSRYTVTYSLNL